jgi:hypothetical protein
VDKEAISEKGVRKGEKFDNYPEHRPGIGVQ